VAQSVGRFNAGGAAVDLSPNRATALGRRSAPRNSQISCVLVQELTIPANLAQIRTILLTIEGWR
jgi:hypothetical protein